MPLITRAATIDFSVNISPRLNTTIPRRKCEVMTAVKRPIPIARIGSEMRIAVSKKTDIIVYAALTTLLFI